MENVLRDKNENVSTGQLLLPSKTDMENLSAGNLKENHNPRSLLEIASDTSTKFQLDASTPNNKNSKKSSFKDVSFNITTGNNESISCQENIPFNESSSGLSFLANGFNNLKIKTDETTSDDEEQFLSFNDMSNRIADQTRSMENLNEKHDETLILENNQSDLKSPEDNAIAITNNTVEAIKEDEIIAVKELSEPVEIVKEQTDSIEIIKTRTDSVEIIKEQAQPVEIIEEQTHPVEIIKEQPEPVDIVNEKTNVVENIKEQVKPVEFVKDQIEPAEIIKEQIESVEHKIVIQESEPIEKNEEIIVNDHKMPIMQVEKEVNVIKDENERSDEKEQNMPIAEKEVCEEKINEDVISEENAEFEDAEDMPQLDSTNVVYDSPNNASGNITQVLNDFEISPDQDQNTQKIATENSKTTENTKINDTFDEMKLKELPMNATFEETEHAAQNTSYSMHTTMPLYDLEQHESQFSSTFNKSSDHVEFADARSIGMENPQLTQIIEESHINSTFDTSRHSDANMMHSTFNQTKPVDSPTFSNIDDLRVNRTHNINECKSNINVTQDMLNFDMSLARPNIQNETVTLNNTFEGIKCTNDNKNFTESLRPNLDIQFKMPTMPVSRKSTERNQNQNFGNEEFTSAVSYNFGDSDFDFLQKFGSNSSDQNFGRDSVLLKFDPLLAKPIPQATTNFEKLAEEDELVSETVPKDSTTELQLQETKSAENSFSSVADEFPQLIPLDTKDMSVEIMKDIASENEKQIDNLDCEEIKHSSIDHHENQNNKLMELENKMRMEAEQREEVLLKRISEKDKQISKMSNVVKEYEKAIAELIAEKEQLVQSYEKKCADLKNDSEMNAQHLTSLESTFSDLHAKYERTKQLALDLKEREESTLQDRKSLMDNLKMQEARYDKMKTHAMAQLEIANNKLAEMLRNHQAEVTKLKAQLKKEEISRASINEQLIQKSKENEELVKICDELIGNHGNSHAV
ncbi:putative leucine-rich repeat-containing protein DDB_G0290503 isoform X2 [Chironomus tepperi]|uniref:putative leucine-rich repeat-containing protein DDB_G0290503 isoform X2 n=1 Tax=Chironomus tepperi TaxID=113505 RepID=UPI00391FB23E